MEQQAHDTLPPGQDFSWQAQPARHTTQRLRELLAKANVAPTVLENVARLESAFQVMPGRGVVSRHDYSCCMVCGSAEIRDEVAATLRAGQPAQGFVFYHWSDTDDVVTTGRIALSFGSRLGGPLGVSEIGAEVVKALREAGLQASWNGSPTGRIEVKLGA